jgi:hypothetical protein
MSLRFSPFLSFGEVLNSRRECAILETGDAKFAISKYGIERTNRVHRDALPKGAILPISSGPRVRSSPSVSS